MYCGQCGKKVRDHMLYCPFCGSAIEIPEQDEVEQEPDVQADAAVKVQPAWVDTKSEELAENAPDAPATDETAAQEAEEFVPLWFDFDEAVKQQEAEKIQAEAIVSPPDAQDTPGETALQQPPETKAKKRPETPRRPERPRQASARPKAPARRAANTYIPVKEISVDELFMDDEPGLEDDPDDYDLLEGDAYAQQEIYEFEDRETGTFFQRHVRGIVGLILFLILILITGIWALTTNGQISLARLNLAWEADAYAQLGYEAYQQDSDRLAARYYERALARDPDNYEYAHSAMVAYYEADNLDSATAMLKKCIQMRPDDPDPYQELLILYPDPSSRPWEVTELIRQGYQRTGHAALNIG